MKWKEKGGSRRREGPPTRQMLPADPESVDREFTAVLSHQLCLIFSTLGTIALPGPVQGIPPLKDHREGCHALQEIFQPVISNLQVSCT